MKHLILLRHGDAIIKMGLEDKERNLSSLGEVQAIQLGKLLKEKDFQPDKVICSDAVRTKQTAQIILRQLFMDLDMIETNHTLYNQEIENYSEVLLATDDINDTLMMVGHNPTISYFAHHLMGGEFHNFNTCGFVVLAWDVDAWQKTKNLKCDMLLRG